MAQLTPRDLQAAAAQHLRIEEYFVDLKRGGAYMPLFGWTERRGADFEIVIWGNAWLISPERKKELEESVTHFEVYEYIQQGFHPSFWLAGADPSRGRYEPIYGGPSEPLVLGWSSDNRKIDATISQEFERHYQLTQSTSGRATAWHSSKEAVGDVVLREINPDRDYVIALKDYIQDYQDVRQRWYLLAYYGEWTHKSFDVYKDSDVIRADFHDRGTRREHLTGLPNENSDGFTYIEVRGYLLVAPPDEPQFSRQVGGIPRSVQDAAERIEFHTSHGRARPSHVSQHRYQSGHFGHTVVFDQEVLRKYQDQPDATIEFERPYELRLRTPSGNLSRGAMLLGCEYISISLGRFVEGIPETEWGHWQVFNVPFIGHEKHRELVRLPSLFALAEGLDRAANSVNAAVRSLTGSNEYAPFRPHGKDAEKEIRVLVRALPRKASVSELLERAQCLNSFVVERLPINTIRRFLRHRGFPASELEKMGSLKLFTSMIAICHIASRSLVWIQDVDGALAFAAKKMKQWQQQPWSGSSDEDFRLIEEVMHNCESLFAIYELRILSAHPGDEKKAPDILKEHLSLEVPSTNFRDATLALYHALIASLDYAGSF